jgi:hypothetical protein
MYVWFVLSTLRSKHCYLKHGFEKNERLKAENKADMEWSKYPHFWRVIQRELKYCKCSRICHQNGTKRSCTFIENSCEYGVYQVSAYGHIAHRLSPQVLIRSCLQNSSFLYNILDIGYIFVFHYVIRSNARCQLRIFRLL